LRFPRSGRLLTTGIWFYPLWKGYPFAQSGAFAESRIKVLWILEKCSSSLILLLLSVIFSKSVTVAAMAVLPDKEVCAAGKTVYVVNYGLHTGIVVNREDFIASMPMLAGNFPNGNYVEIGWGDAKFYQSRNPSIYLAIQAMFWPTESVLHVVAIPGMPRHYFSNDVNIIELSLTQDGYQRLLNYLAGTFTYLDNRQIVLLGPGLYGSSYFYRAEGEFHAFNNCNTWVARSLEQSGYPISSRGVVTATSLLSRIRSQGQVETESGCFSR
jgi:uncharacterized protein (TIGR02117 family)